jgi:glucose/mannose transport system substrate-binding protein
MPRNPAAPRAAAALSALLLLSPAQAQPTVEVLHFWTSGSEAAALKVVKDAFEKAGGKWIDVPVSGGGGDGMLQVLSARISAGNPPDFGMLFTPARMAGWDEQGLLGDLDGVARAEDWDRLLTPFTSKNLKYKGKYAAAPLGLERINILYANKAVLEKAGVKTGPGWPRNWDEFNAAADKIQKAGFIPLAHGGQPWQEETLFVSVAAGVGGPKFFQKALVDLDPDALSGPVMVKVFDQMRRLKGYTDRGSPGRDWNLATAMVARGEAGMQLMGSWAKGEFYAAGKTPGKDFLCAAAPGTADMFFGGPDPLGAFKPRDKDHADGQKLLAHVIMSEPVQIGFSVFKGTTPPRLGVSTKSFDACAREQIAEFARAGARGAVFSGMASESSPAVLGAIRDVVVQHFNSDMSSSEAAKLLARAVENAK